MDDIPLTLGWQCPLLNAHKSINNTINNKTLKLLKEN